MQYVKGKKKHKQNRIIKKAVQDQSGEPTIELEETFF